MLTDKELKKKFKKVAGSEPDKFYATSVLRAEGFHRKQCSCATHFWTTHAGETRCGDPACRGRVDIFERPPVKKKLTFTQVWTGFRAFFEERGYKPINRYPVISRWNPTTDFTNASIAAFQPYVISGESDAPAKKLVIPQFCLRFGDVDNVGITGSHCTGFVMIGQHAFVSREEWDQSEVFRDIYEYITKEVGIPKTELTLHEDAWAGGGNYGPCMEFFSRGVELFNQVYMMYEHKESGDRELDLKVLDMGLGMERVAWFSQGSMTVYDAAFPQVIEKLVHKLKVSFDRELYVKFAPVAARLNFDETEDIDAAWKSVAKEIGLGVDELRSKILPMTALYSVAEHSRALLFAITDSGLPSNVGGYYNLRVIFRRAMDFIEHFGWDISLEQVCSWHASELKELYPELAESLEDVSKILAVEKDKYLASKKKGLGIVESALSKRVDTDKLIELYDSHGISPEQTKVIALKKGIKIEIPDNFYLLVGEKHAKQEQKTQTKKEKEVELGELAPTQALYFDSYDYVDFKAQVLKIAGKHVVLDRTAFYPTSGGQLHDKGTLGKQEVVDVFKQGSMIVHELAEEPGFEQGDEIEGRVDIDTRMQLAQHHTAAHILNGVSKKLLGNHVWQAGAAKSLEKARLDITHYESLSDEQTAAIEKMANEVIQRNLPIIKTFMPRALAEAKYGFGLYQGGAVPGRQIRVVSIEGLDVEACGGTHLNLTGEARLIKILKTSKLQDGIVRIEFTAGDAAVKSSSQEKSSLEKTARLLGVDVSELPSRVEELFEKWKKARKSKLTPQERALTRRDKYSGDVMAKVCQILKTQPEHVNKTIERFLKEM